MTIRVLHTSDWHIDVSPKKAPRRQDHIHLMDQLMSLIETHQPQILVHSGDIFDRSLISAAGMKIFSDFLNRLSSTSIQEVCIIAGNHDPSAYLDAIGPFLDMNHVGQNIRFHLSTSLHKKEEDVVDSEKHCIMLDINGEKIGVAMLPFVSAHRLGVYSRTETQKNISLRKKFAGMFTDFADHLSAMDPDAPLLGVAHLNCWDEDDDDVSSTHAPEKIHLGETLDADTFDKRFDYVALGHFHNHRSMDGGRVCYAGSPIPFRRNEVGQKGVVLIEFDGKNRTKTFLPIADTLRASIIVEAPESDWEDMLKQALLRHENKVVAGVVVPHYVYVKITDLTKTENQCQRIAQTIAQECDRSLEIVSFIGRRKEEYDGLSYSGFDQERTFENFFTRLFNEGYERKHPNEEDDPDWVKKRDEARRAFENLIRKWRKS